NVGEGGGPREGPAGRQQRRPRRRADPVAPARRAVVGAEDVRDLATRTEHHLPVLRRANAQPRCRARRPLRHIRDHRGGGTDRYGCPENNPHRPKPILHSRLLRRVSSRRRRSRTSLLGDTTASTALDAARANTTALDARAWIVDGELWRRPGRVRTIDRRTSCLPEG